MDDKPQTTTPEAVDILPLLKGALKPKAVKQLAEHFDQKCWHFICTDEDIVNQMSVSFFLKYATRISEENWVSLLTHKNTFTRNLLRKHAHCISSGENWNYLCSSRQEDIDEEFVNKYIDRMDTVAWENVLYETSAQHPETLLERFAHMFDVHCWVHILEYQRDISLKFIERHVDKYNFRCWRNIASKHRSKLSLEFIEKYADKFDTYSWEKLVRIVSEIPDDEFLIRHGHRFSTIMWCHILFTRSCSTILSEKVVSVCRHYFDTECWDTISRWYGKGLIMKPLPDSIRALIPIRVYSDMEVVSSERVFK